MKIKCMIVEDEPLARKGIEENILDLEYLELAGIAENAVQARKLLEQLPVDLIFLDINMPKVTGLEFLRNLNQKPMVIIISAYPEYALEGFELDVLDYLVKPVTYSRFEKAAEKAREFYLLKNRDQEPTRESYFFIKTESKFEKIFFRDLLYVEAADNYVLIHTTEKKHIAYVTIKIMEEKLPKQDFIKVHKSFIISIQQIKSIEGNEVIIGKSKIPISRGLKDQVMEMIVNRNLLKR